MKQSRKKSIFKNIMRALAFLSLAAAYVIGYINTDHKTLRILEEKISAGRELIKIGDNPLIYETQALGKDSFSGYYVITGTQGWGGPLQIATAINRQGAVYEVLVLSHKETPSFFNKLQRKEFFEQFKEKNIASPFLPEENIDTITQATISSEAFIKAIRMGSHSTAKKIFNLNVLEKKPEWKFGLNEILLLGLFLVLLTGLILKNKLLRYFAMAASFFFLGFYLNSSLSIAHFGSLLLGYFPPVRIHTFWWILVVGTLMTAFLLKRNLYCYGLCPFGNLQELNSRISGINVRLNSRILKITKYMSRFLTWLALILIFLTTKPVLGAYEPFPVLFGLEGIEIQWFILPVVILGSFVFTRFFCRFFCPVGVVLNLTIKGRRKLDKFVGKIVNLDYS
jgi:Na+-translocating ferredoxin:NAD+ oxidoreductase RnfG subunit